MIHIARPPAHVEVSAKKKEMALDFVQLEFFVYGFLFVAWTHDIGWAIAGPMILWFGIVWTGIHREDVDELQFQFHVYTLLTLLFGVWTGMVFVWRLRSPRMVDFRTFHVDKGGRLDLFTPAAASYIVQVFLITLGVYYLLGTFSDGAGSVSDAVALGVGLTLVIVFSVTLIITVVVKTVGYGVTDPNRRRIDRLNIKNGLPLAALLATPAIYDYLALSGFDTWHGAVLLAALVVLYFLFFWYQGYIAWWVNDGDSFLYKTYLDQQHRSRSGNLAQGYEALHSKAEVLWFIMLSGGVHFLSMLAGWLVDIFSADGDPVPLVILFLLLAFFWSMVFIVISEFGGVVFPSRKFPPALVRALTEKTRYFFS